MSSPEAELLRVTTDATIAVPHDCQNCRHGFRECRVLQDVWLNDTELAALIAGIEPPAQELRAWGRITEYGLVSAARTAVMAGEIALADVMSPTCWRPSKKKDYT